MEGLVLTLLLGVFIVVGAFIVFLTKNNAKFIDFSIALAAGVIFMLLWIDILPEAYEVIEASNGGWKALYILAGALIGFCLLKGLDHFIPDHDDDLTTSSDDEANLKHISLISSIALVLHNIVEGMAVYTLTISDFTAGVMASLGVGLHNIPLGMVIASTFYQTTNDKKKTWGLIALISLSTFLGGVNVYVFHFMEIMNVIKAISLTLTLGMLLYILMMELLPKMIHSKNKKITTSGFLLGVILLLLTLLMHSHDH